MSQNTNSTTTEVKLTDPNDWDAWNHQFKAQAMASHLWEHIDQLEPLLPKPKMPLIEAYHTARRSNAEASNAEASQELSAIELTA